MVHVSLKSGLENFEHYFSSMWDECNCAVVWAFFGIVFLWDWNEKWPFPVLCLVQFHLSVVSDAWQPHGLQYARLPFPSPTPRACSNSCQSNRWCHPTISSSVIPFSPRLQSFQASGSFPMSHFFGSGCQSIGVSASASVFPMNIQDWFPLTFLAVQETLKNVLQHHSSKALILQHSAFFIFIHIWLLEKPYLWLEGPLSAK